MFLLDLNLCLLDLLYFYFVCFFSNFNFKTDGGHVSECETPDDMDPRSIEEEGVEEDEEEEEEEVEEEDDEHLQPPSQPDNDLQARISHLYPSHNKTVTTRQIHEVAKNFYSLNYQEHKS